MSDRDVKQYRVKNKLVEPSGSRADRPDLLAALQDASKGEFDLILAWRKDRLYCGLRSMLMVLEAVDLHKITILLVKETFDPNIAPIRAWAAQMELESMQERMTMGVIARLKAGKANTGQDRYGYVRIGEQIHVLDEEAKRVRQIFAWCIQKTPLMQIRTRLIAANAPQKESSIHRHIQWPRSSIQAILKSAREYAYGFKAYSRAGQTFHIPGAPVIGMPIYEMFVKMREENKTYPKHRRQNDYLLSGRLKCACNLTWRARTATHRRGRRGEWVERKTPISTYFCPQPHKELRSPDCPNSVGAKHAEAQVWEKLYEFVRNPAFLLAQGNLLPTNSRQGLETGLGGHCEGVGSGLGALEYLAPYIFRVAISNNRLIKLENDQVTFRYRDTESGKEKLCTLGAEEFIRRFLQHVHPRSFVKVRYYGLFSPSLRKKLDFLRQNLEDASGTTTQDQETDNHLQTD